MSNQRFREDKAGTLVHYPQEGEPSSSATVVVYYPGGGELQASAAATCDSTSTTMATSYARGVTTVAVASGSGITAGKKYLIEEGGRKQPVTVKAVSSTTVYLYDKLAFSVTSSATFKGYSLTYALTSTHTADKDLNYRASWTYAIGGVTYYADSFFDVVGAVDWYATTWSDVLARHGWVSEEVRDPDLDGARYLATGWEVLREKFNARGKRLERLRTVDAAKASHCAVVAWLLADERAMRDPAMLPMLEQAERRLKEALDELLSNVGFYDDNEDLAAGADEQGVVVPQWVITR